MALLLFLDGEGGLPEVLPFKRLNEAVIVTHSLLFQLLGSRVHVGERPKSKSHADVALKTRFGANVKSYRQRLGVSQEELAWRADMHRTYLADIERGGRNISLSSIVRLVNALGITLAQFFSTLETTAPHAADAPARRKARLLDNSDSLPKRRVPRQRRP